MRYLLPIASFIFLEAVRSRLFAFVLLVLLLGITLVEFIGGIAITESTAIKTGVLAALLRLFAVFIVALFVTASMAREFNDKGLEQTLSLPMPRASYYFGKLLGFLAVALLISTMIGLSLCLYAPIPQVLLWTISLTCELFIVAAFSLVCAFSFSQIPVTLSAVAGFYLLARSINAIQLMGHGPLIDPFSLSQKLMGGLVDGIAYLLPSLHVFTQADWLMYGSGQWSLLLSIAGQSLVYLALLAGVGLFDLYRKNL
jgi:ABC-type transport system involved in multi-copper enzyme maturation permease subunit